MSLDKDAALSKVARHVFLPNPGAAQRADRRVASIYTAKRNTVSNTLSAAAAADLTALYLLALVLEQR